MPQPGEANPAAWASMINPNTPADPSALPQGVYERVDMVTGQPVDANGNPLVGPAAQAIIGNKIQTRIRTEDGDALNIGDGNVIYEDPSKQAMREDSVRINAYYDEQNRPYVYIDGKSPAALGQVNATQLAYRYRIRMGIPSAGIDTSFGPYLVGPKDDPKSLFGDEAKTWRVMVRLLVPDF